MKKEIGGLKKDEENQRTNQTMEGKELEKFKKELIKSLSSQDIYFIYIYKDLKFGKIEVTFRDGVPQKIITKEKNIDLGKPPGLDRPSREK